VNCLRSRRTYSLPLTTSSASVSRETPSEAEDEEEDEPAVWYDSDDDRLAVSLASQALLDRKPKIGERMGVESHTSESARAAKSWSSPSSAADFIPSPETPSEAEDEEEDEPAVWYDSDDDRLAAKIGERMGVESHTSESARAAKSWSSPSSASSLTWATKLARMRTTCPRKMRRRRS
jgi:hypothetical protein